MAWRADLVAEVLARHTDGPLLIAGCSEEQIALPFDYRVPLTAPPPELADRLLVRIAEREARRARPDRVAQATSAARRGAR